MSMKSARGGSNRRPLLFSLVIIFFSVGIYDEKNCAQRLADKMEKHSKEKKEEIPAYIRDVVFACNLS